MNKELLAELRVDRRYGVTIDTQIAYAIRAMITSNAIHFNEELPTVDFLAPHLQVTVEEVQSAYDMLVKEKVITLRNEVYQVSYFEVSNRFHQSMITITDALKKMNLEPSIKTVTFTKMIVSSSFAKKSGLKEGEMVLRMKRIYSGDHIPFIVYDGYLPLSVFPHLDTVLVENEPYYPVLVKNYHIQFKVSNRKLRVCNMSPEDALLFQVPEGSPTYYLQSHLYGTDGTLLEYAESFSSPHYYFQYEHRA